MLIAPLVAVSSRPQGPQVPLRGGGGAPPILRRGGCWCICGGAQTTWQELVATANEKDIASLALWATQAKAKRTLMTINVPMFAMIAAEQVTVTIRVGLLFLGHRLLSLVDLPVSRSTQR